MNVILPEDADEMALTMNGKKRNIRKKDFYLLAEKCGLAEKVVEKMIKKIAASKEKFFVQCEASYLPEEKKEEMKRLIEKRIEVLL